MNKKDEFALGPTEYAMKYINDTDYKNRLHFINGRWYGKMGNYISNIDLVIKTLTFNAKINRNPDSPFLRLNTEAQRKDFIQTIEDYDKSVVNDKWHDNPRVARTLNRFKENPNYIPSNKLVYPLDKKALVMIGAIMFDFEQRRKLFCLIGEGGSGKSTIKNILEKLYTYKQRSVNGRDTEIVSVDFKPLDLRQIKSSSFDLAESYTSRLITVDDMSNTDMNFDWSIFKSLVTGCCISQSLKYQSLKKINIKMSILTCSNKPFFIDLADGLQSRVAVYRLDGSHYKKGDVDTKWTNCDEYTDEELDLILDNAYYEFMKYYKEDKTGLNWFNELFAHDTFTCGNRGNSVYHFVMEEYAHNEEDFLKQLKEDKYETKYMNVYNKYIDWCNMTGFKNNAKNSVIFKQRMDELIDECHYLWGEDNAKIDPATLTELEQDTLDMLFDNDPMYEFDPVDCKYIRK